MKEDIIVLAVNILFVAWFIAACYFLAYAMAYEYLANEADKKLKKIDRAIKRQQRRLAKEQP